MTEREKLVSENKLEDMTFESYCYMVSKETDEKILDSGRPKLIELVRVFYDGGVSTFSPLLKDRVWDSYGRVA